MVFFPAFVAGFFLWLVPVAGTSLVADGKSGGVGEVVDPFPALAHIECSEIEVRGLDSLAAGE